MPAEDTLTSPSGLDVNKLLRELVPFAVEYEAQAPILLAILRTSAVCSQNSQRTKEKSHGRAEGLTG